MRIRERNKDDVIHKEGFPFSFLRKKLEMGMIYMVLCTVFANRARSLVEIKSFEHRIYLFIFVIFWCYPFLWRMQEL